MITAMILAAGTGSRVGADRPKQFVEIFGKPVLAYTIEIYQKHPQVDNILVVCHKDWLDYLKEMVTRYQLTKVKWITEGGDTFQDTVVNGVTYLQDKLTREDMVMIHYGAAPFTSEKIVSDSILVCETYGMSASCTPCYQLMGTKETDGTSKAWVDREKLLQIACPQSFRYGYLCELYDEAGKRGLLDTVEPHTTSLMYALGKTIYPSYGDQTNIKITTKEDLEFLKLLE